MQANIILTGDKQLDAALATMPAKMQKKGIRKATREAAKVVLADVRRRTPKHTGALARSWKVRTARRSNGKPLRRGTMGHAVASVSGPLFRGDQFYFGFLEFGTKSRYTKGHLRRGVNRVARGLYRGEIRERDHSFLRRSLYGSQFRVKMLFRRHLAAALKQIAAEAK